MRHPILLTGLTALLLACGKDEPTPPTPPPQPAAGSPLAAGESDKAKEEVPQKFVEPKEPGGSSAAPGVTPAPTPTPAAGAPLPPIAPSLAPPERAALTPTSVASFPSDVVAVGGTPSLKALLQAFMSQSQRVQGAQLPPDPLGMALGALQTRAGIDLSWLDTDKPLRFAVPDPKKYPEAVVLLLPEKAGAAFDPKSLKDAKVGGGHLASLMVGEGDKQREIFFDRPVEGLVLVTSHGDFAKSLDAFVKELAAWTPKDPLVLEASVENLVRIYGDELKEAKEMVGSMAGKSADPKMAQQLGPMLRFAEGGFALVEGVSRASLSLDPSGDFPRLGVALRALPGTGVEAFIKNLNGRKMTLAGVVPADAWLVMGSDIPGLSFMGEAESMVEAITSGTMGPFPVSWSDDEKKTLLALFKKSMDLQGSQSVSWLRQDAGRPFVFEGVSDSKDGPAMQTATLEIGEFMFKKLYAVGRKAMLAQGMAENQVPSELGFKDFVAMVSKNSAPIGVGANVSEASSKAGTKVGGLEVSMDWSRLPLRGGIAAKLSDFVGPSVGLAMAGEGQRFAVSLGPDAAGRVARLLDAAAAPGEPSDAWLAKADDQVFFLLLRPARLMRVLSELVPGLMEHRAAIGAMPDDPVMIGGTSDGTTLLIEGTFPARLIETLGKLQ